jgi:CBS domain containing-hemolysin-like protein
MENQVLTGLFLAACLALSFLLSGMEAGVFALNRLRVRQLARAGRPSARLLHNFLEHPENFLWTILVGNTLANFIILGWVVATLHNHFPGRYAMITGLFTGIVFLFYALFDLLPKMLFRAHPNQLCLSAARIFWPVHLVLRPLVAVVETSAAGALRWTGGHAFTGRPFGNREEMRAVMQETAQTFTTGERAMINRVLDLQTFTVRQIAMPLAQVVTVETSTLIGDALTLARERNFSRMPVWETRDGKRRIAGLLMLGPLLFRDDLDLQKPAAAHMTPALFLDEDTRLEVALRRMQRAGERLAIVLGRDRHESGMVTLEDILKVMFGEMKL